MICRHVTGPAGKRRRGCDRTSVPKVLWSPRAVTIREHLDSISTQADWSWDYAADRDVIIVRDIEKNRFTLAAQPVSTVSRSAVRNLVSEDGEAQNDNTGEVTLDPYREEVLQAVRGILGLNEDSGGASEGSAVDPRTRVTIMPSANLLSVTAKPNAMRQVEDLIGPPTELTYNESTAATVRIDLSIMEVELNDTRERNLLVQLIRNSSDLPLNVLLGGLTAGAGLPDYSPDDTDTGTNVAVLGPSESSGRYAGSGAVVEWLDQFGKASIQYSDTVEVQNNRVVTRDQTVSRQYVKSITVESLGEGSDVPTREIDIDELRTGIVFHMQPTVVDDEITVRISLSRAALIREEPYDYIGIQGTNFTTENFNRVISVSLEDGEPKLLASFSEREVRETRRSRIPLFGSLGRGRSDRQRETLLLITATRVQRQGA